MHSPQPPPFPFAADPTLLVTYADCERYVRARMNSFIHGELKPWLEQIQPAVSYTAAVGLKNETLMRESPKLVQRLLAACGYETQAMQWRAPDGVAVYHFAFASKEALATFRQQLAMIPLGPANSKPAGATKQTPPRQSGGRKGNHKA